ncbi:MAG: trypsin-like peptidase domain-containing protein [Chitinophagaceae bacterium]|nr:trypsin-like peptidase domain-containing protein [Chitinophagaceae bacterium]
MEQDLLLLDAIERYYRGEMSHEEAAQFEELRKSNAHIDQLAVEHIFFLEQLDNLSKISNLKSVMNSVEDKLELEGAINFKNSKLKAKVVHIWKRYKRTISVAAAAAVLVSIFTATGVSFLSQNKKSALTPLVDNKINQLENKLNQMESKLNHVASTKTPFTANFRATGFLLDGRGYVITNAHVVSRAKNLIVENQQGNQYAATAVYTNPITDLAILKITDSSFKKVKSIPYNLAKSGSSLAEQIFTLGYPREDIVYNQGYLSATTGYSGDTSAYQISISVNPGNSGGPVLDKKGEVIGIISSKETNADGVVFAIKSKSIIEAVKEMKEKTGDSIRIPSNNTLKGHSRVQQIDSIENYIFKVKGN